MTKRTRVFRNGDEYTDFFDNYDDVYSFQFIPCIVDDGSKISCDISVCCKSAKTAYKHFQKAFTGYNENLDEWISTFDELVNNGYYTDFNLDDGNDFYMFDVEKVDDGLWYISLVISGFYRNY